MAGGGGAVGGGLKVAADGHLVVDEDVSEPGEADASEQLIDDFTRIVTPPVPTAGDPLNVDTTRWRAETTYMRHGSPGGVLVESGPTFGIGQVGSISVQPGSYVGTYATPHTQRPPGTGCGGLEFWYAGWRDVEGWWRLTVPEHPADMAGITLQVTAGSGNAIDLANGYEVVVRGSAPTESWTGSPVGSAAGGGTTTVTIPAGLVPAQGQELWIGVRPAWRCDYYETYCGWNWPWDIPVLNSSRGAAVTVGALTWLVEASSGDSLGTTIEYDDDDAAFDGGNEWRDAGTEGSPTWGIDGQSFWVESEEPAGKGIMLVGEREDEDEPWGPWGAGWSFVFDFEVSAVGDTGAAGIRHIEVTTTRPGERTVGYVHLGDMTRAAGVSVVGTTTDYRPVAITANETWTARFDDQLITEDEDEEPVRWLRAKVWRKADGEPAGWQVRTPVPVTEDIGDRVVIWFRVGNGAGQPQRVRFIRPRAVTEETLTGMWVREYLGRADGLTARVDLSHAHVLGTLTIDVNGITAPPEREEPGTGWLDTFPTVGSFLWAHYLAE